MPAKEPVEDPRIQEAEPTPFNDPDIQVIPEDKQDIDPLPAMEVKAPEEALADLPIKEAKLDVSQEVSTINVDPDPVIKQEPESEETTPQPWQSACMMHPVTCLQPTMQGKFHHETTAITDGEVIEVDP